ncbi:MAG: YraN family protein [Lachnospiraceae bacterium]|nr:YraN family protein [Lachnospiraceae bacterium]
MNKRETGMKYEEHAAAYLITRGLVLLERNFRCRQGEVDLIGIHEECLVFAEVKYRKNAKSGMPEEAVDIKKQARICMVSDYYRLTHPKERARQVRYDVVAICKEGIVWYRNAFPYISKGRGYGW